MSQAHHTPQAAAANPVKMHSAHTDTQTGIAAELIPVTLTPAALTHLKQILKAQKKAIGLRLAIKASGCSGYSYVVELMDKSNEGDVLFPIEEGLLIAVDRKSYPMLKGTSIDYVRKGLNSHFVYNNPNQAGECGCGESFSVKGE